MADSMTVRSIKGQIDVYKRNLKNTGPNTIGRRNAEKQIKRLQTRLKRLQKGQPKVVETEAIFDKKPTSAQRARKTMDKKARQIKKTTTEVPRAKQSKAAALAVIGSIPGAALSGKFAPLLRSIKALGTGEKLSQNLQNKLNKAIESFKSKPPKTTTKIPPTPKKPSTKTTKKPLGPSVKGIKPPKVITTRPPTKITTKPPTKITKKPLGPSVKGIKPPKVITTRPPTKITTKPPTKITKKPSTKTTKKPLRTRIVSAARKRATTPNIIKGKAVIPTVTALGPKSVKAKDPIYRNVVTKKPEPIRYQDDEGAPLGTASEKSTLTTDKKRKSLFDAMLGDPIKTGDFSAKDQIVKNPFTGKDMQLTYEYPEDPDEGMKKGGSIKKNMKKKKAKTKVKKRAALRGYGKALRGF